MGLPPYDPISVPALRDALGLARILYAAERAAGATEDRLRTVGEGGRLLALALEQTTRFQRGTLGHRAAPNNAGYGFDTLARVTWTPEVAALLTEARARVFRRHNGRSSTPVG